MAEANPYLNARREWDERYGDAVARARNWRLVAFGSLIVAGIAVAGITYIGAQSKIKPYVVAIDKMGNPVAMAQPSTGAVSQRIVTAQIANWIWNARTVLGDAAAQRTLIARVYAMAGPEAANFLNAYYKQNPPFGDFAVAVTITSVLPISKDTWQVGWDEIRTVHGMVRAPVHWKANITAGIDPRLADSTQVMLDNPLGVYVRSLSWTPTVSGS